ncbi:MAG: glycosyl transferase [Cryomorphaceae bacterium]|nr:glycosyl transferase [Cryomorphaceae bacterium]
MKILYGIQGTGNGHISRALEIIPFLQNHGEVDILISGNEYNLSLPFPIKYKFEGLTFYYNQKGGMDYWKTFRKLKLRKFWRNAWNLPVRSYDLVISDFEPVTAWASWIEGKSCLALSHQASFLAKSTPRPKKPSALGEWILRKYATANTYIGFHFKSYENNIFPPVIRREILEGSIRDAGFFLVYLPSISDENIASVLQSFPNIQWRVYSKWAHESIDKGAVKIYPADANAFARDLKNCTGVITSAGFEVPAEAMYLEKKLLVVPIKGQYEQLCNAAALETLGVKVISNIFDNEQAIKDWIYAPISYQLLSADDTWKDALLEKMQILKKEKLVS